jgi:hypothetical protein
MALVFCDSFDHYATANIANKWDYLSACTIAGGGRFGNCLSWTNWTNGVYKTFSSQTTWVVGFAFKISSFADAPTRHIFGIFDGGTSKASLYFDASGRLTWGGVTSTLALATATWHYLEFKAVSGGVLQARVNGTTWVDTTIGSYTANRIVWGLGTSNGISYQVDDIYICDGTGGVNTDFLGDVRVEYLVPTANGTTTQFTASTGSNYDTVNETTTPSDSDYNSSSTAGHIDLFTLSDLSASGTIKGVQSVIRNLKTDAGTRTVAPKYRIGSTNYSGAASNVLVSVSYALDPMDNSPATASGWTDTEINGMEFGYEVAS